MNTIVAKRLDGANRPALTQHFLALSPHDTYLRFGHARGPTSIQAYVAGIDFHRDAVFGIPDANMALSGVAHVGLLAGTAELGLSVLEDRRGLGYGTALLERAREFARARFIRTLCMHCLSENQAVIHMAVKAGMRIVRESPEADAYLVLPPPDAASAITDFFADRVGHLDWAVKAQLLAARTMHGAFRHAG